MKRSVVRRTGEPEVLEFVDVSEPAVKDNEVLVDLKATGLNWSELMIRRGEWPVDISNGFTLGSEGAGVVDKTGSAVNDLQPGDAVIVLDFNAYLIQEQGCYAQKIAVSREKILKYPQNLSFLEAAAVPLAALTAYDALINHSPLPESGTVVVSACTGATGIAALQVAQRKNLKVIGTTRSETKKRKVQSLGAEVIVEKDPVRLKEKIDDLVKDEGVDYIFDPIGGETATELISLLNFNGTYVNYGNLQGRGLKVPSGFLFQQARIHGYVVMRNLENPNTMQEVWGEVLPLVETREIVIPVQKTFALEDVSQAHLEMEKHTHWGKLVLVQ